MPIYNLTYKDGSQYNINIDLGNKDISISRTKANNVRRWLIKDFGTNLIRDEIVISIFDDHKDSEGDTLLTGTGRSRIIFDKEYFNDMIAYTNAGGILNQGKICIDVILKQILKQTRVFNIGGNFIHPVYFQLTGVSPNNDPNFNNGSITATILQSGGLIDLEVRFRIAGGTWQTWETITNTVQKTALSSNRYEAQVRSTGTTLLIKPIEATSI